MSQPGGGGKKGVGKGVAGIKKATVVDKDDSGPSERATPASKAGDSDSRDETPSSTTERKDSDAPPSKPPSAGTSIRDAANKVLTLASKGEWTPVDQALKALEKYVVNAGEDGNHVPLAGVSDAATGMTPLMYAVKDNRTQLVDRMIELGADVGSRNNDNYNALHIAAMYSREDVVKLLLSKRGVDPFSTGGSRAQTAVHLVASRQTGTATSILRALLAAAGKDIRLKVDGGKKNEIIKTSSIYEKNS